MRWIPLAVFGRMNLDGSREERAFELAKHDYYGFLDYKEDRYTTVYGYMD